MNEAIIRKSEYKDISELKELMLLYIVDFYKKDKPCEKKLESLIKKLIDDHDAGIQFVAECNQKVVGFATLYLSYSTLNVKRQATLNDLYVRSEFRKNSLGKDLFEKCVEYSKEIDCSSMIWETATDNMQAQRLYNSLGGHVSEWVHYELEF